MIGYATLLSVLGISALFFGYTFKTISADLHARWEGLLEFFQIAGVASIVLLILKTFAVDVLKVPSGSMLPNYQIGQYIFTKPAAFGIRDPWQNALVSAAEENDFNHGDVVISRFPYAAYVKYLKRIVAVPGDTISINAQGITVNGQFASFTLVDGQLNTYEVTLMGATWRVVIDADIAFVEQPPITLGPGEVFLLGDNLTKSSDSRELGAISSDHVIARVF